MPPATIYLALFAVQILAESFLVWSVLPAFRTILLNPGHQPPDVPYNYATISALFIMQGAYWYRFRYVAIPYRDANVILSHVMLFLGRLNFIFGGAVFSVVFFRHVPALDSDADIFELARRGVFMAVGLFAMFCVTLEFERLGSALLGSRGN